MISSVFEVPVSILSSRCSPSRVEAQPQSHVIVKAPATSPNNGPVQPRGEVFGARVVSKYPPRCSAATPSETTHSSY